MNTLAINTNIINLNKDYTTNKETIKDLSNANKSIIKTVLDNFLMELKELKSDEAYITYNKKALSNIVSIKLDNELHKDFRQVIKAVVAYYVSNSSLNFKDTKLTKAKFIKAMNLINGTKSTITKFKDNKALYTELKRLDTEALKLKASKA